MGNSIPFITQLEEARRSGKHLVNACRVAAYLEGRELSLQL